MELDFVTSVVSELNKILIWFPNQCPALLVFYNQTVRSLSMDQLKELNEHNAQQEVHF